MFLNGKITLNVYSDASQTAFPLENIPLLTKEFTNSALVGVQPTVFALAGAATQTISLNGVGTVKRLYVYSDAQNINVNINSLGNILFQAGEPAYLPATVTTLIITNAHATISTNVTVILLGS
jgi:hypothetical protein